MEALIFDVCGVMSEESMLNELSSGIQIINDRICKPFVARSEYGYLVIFISVL